MLPGVLLLLLGACCVAQCCSRVAGQFSLGRGETEARGWDVAGGDGWTVSGSSGLLGTNTSARICPIGRDLWMWECCRFPWGE